MEKAVKDISPGVMTPDQFLNKFKRINIRRSNSERPAYAPPPWAAYALGDVVLTNYIFGEQEDWTKYNIVHELGHVWDYRTGNQLSRGLMDTLGTRVLVPTFPGWVWDPFVSTESYPGTPLRCIDKETGLSDYSIPDCQPYSMTYGGAPMFTKPGSEDWATSFATFIYPLIWFTNPDDLRIGLIPGIIRETYVREQIQR